jgi:dCMP deaminase
MFESFQQSSPLDNNNDSIEESESLLESKRVRYNARTTPKSSKIQKETVVLPHETPIAKYLRLPEQEATSRVDAAAPVTIIMTPKRYGYLDWDDYFLGIAILSSKRSKDPDHAEGACIVDSNNRIVAIGYSGFPKGCPDTIFPWNDYDNQQNNDGDGNSNNFPWLHSKQPYVCPAINNAILNKCSQDVAGCRLYVMEFPSSDCVKVMIQSGIQELIILKPFHENGDGPSSQTNTGALTDDQQASRIMLEMSNIQVRYHQPSVPSINLDFISVVDPLTEEEEQQQQKKAWEKKCCSGSPSSVVELTAEEKFAMDILHEEAHYNASAVTDNGRRKNYLSWDDYFMSVAFLTAQRSKDPNTQVGACIVDDDHRIVGLGCKLVTRPSP